ncbi:unnamed protein product [Eruca vesicaria subsp. sativa]|uniref:Uncharacterized protein n=1 Tax=Eruca vesicaria subsp. sativa TaxID=29727 RepID=A0ABC8K7I6_ERUVS|nr:unnamed protein product [Eruca vesicaria subsp. sativa]
MGEELLDGEEKREELLDVISEEAGALATAGRTKSMNSNTLHHYGTFQTASTSPRSTTDSPAIFGISAFAFLDIRACKVRMI